MSYNGSSCHMPSHAHLMVQDGENVELIDERGVADDRGEGGDADPWLEADPVLQIRAALDEGKYPLFVAEGESLQKIERIRQRLS